MQQYLRTCGVKEESCIAAWSKSNCNLRINSELSLTPSAVAIAIAISLFVKLPDKAIIAALILLTISSKE
jgi:hypothetical protein